MWFVKWLALLLLLVGAFGVALWGWSHMNQLADEKLDEYMAQLVEGVQSNSNNPLPGQFSDVIRESRMCSLVGFVLLIGAAFAGGTAVRQLVSFEQFKSASVELNAPEGEPDA